VDLLAPFFAGMFMANGVPHFVKGITGQNFMTPFKRVSDAYTNVLWGFSNFVIAILCLGTDPVTGEVNRPGGLGLWSFVAGALVLSLTAAWLFSNPKAKLPWHKD